MDKTDILNKLASYPARWFLSFSQESGNSFLTSALKILFKNGLKASGDFAVENLRIDKQNYNVNSSFGYLSSQRARAID